MVQNTASAGGLASPAVTPGRDRVFYQTEDKMNQCEQLRKYNRWRRGDNRIKQPDPKKLGELIDGVADRLEVLEREHAEFFDKWHNERRERERLILTVENAVAIAIKFCGIQGDHPKAWVIEQMVRTLCGGGDGIQGWRDTGEPLHEPADSQPESKANAITHQPKGGMCANCEKLLSNCSDLNFSAMPVIHTLADGVKVVRCVEHVHTLRKC